MALEAPIDHDMRPVIWDRTVAEPVISYPMLREDLSVDLIIIGAGFCGLNAAIHAAQGGLKVAVLEAGTIGCGGSGRSGGYCVPQFPGVLTPSAVCTLLGERRGKLLTEMVGSGADAVFLQIKEFRINCSPVQQGWMQPAHSRRSLEKIRQVYDEWKALGAKVRWCSAADISDLLGASGYIGGWLNATGGTVNPYGLCVGLARAATQCGVRIFEHSIAQRIEQTPDGVSVITGNSRLRGRLVIAATNGYTPATLPILRKSAVPVWLYHVATRPLRAEIRHSVLRTKMCFTDIRKSSGFGRLDPGGRLVSGGLVFAAANRESYARRHSGHRLKEIFPQLNRDDLAFESYWEGFCAVSDSYLPHVQRMGENVFGVIGFSTRGINTAHLLGRTLGEFAAGRRALGDIPVSVTDQRKDVSMWWTKALGARVILPLYQAKDRLGLS